MGDQCSKRMVIIIVYVFSCWRLFVFCLSFNRKLIPFHQWYLEQYLFWQGDVFIISISASMHCMGNHRSTTKWHLYATSNHYSYVIFNLQTFWTFGMTNHSEFNYIYSLVLLCVTEEIVFMWAEVIWILVSLNFFSSQDSKDKLSLED